MMNGIAALEKYLLEDPDLELEVKGNVYVGYFPPEKVAEMPVKAVVIRGAGGNPDDRLDTIHLQQIEIVSAGASAFEAMTVDLAVCQVLKDLDRKTIGGVLLHNAQVAGGAQQSMNPENNAWHECKRQAVLRFDEREVEYGTL
jgi:hypothetical protein